MFIARIFFLQNSLLASNPIRARLDSKKRSAGVEFANVPLDKVLPVASMYMLASSGRAAIKEAVIYLFNKGTIQLIE